MQLDGRTALITGGASGLGEATARLFLANGAKAAILDRNAQKGSALAGEAGPSAVFIETDVADERSAERAVQLAEQALGPISICINCAGAGGMTPTATPEGPMPLSEFRRLIDINLVGVFNVARLAAARMIHNPPDPETGERGVIVSTSSIARAEGGANTVAYSAAKAGVSGMTLPMARDLGPYAIRVVAIAPGIFDTPMLEGAPKELLQHFYAQNEFPKRGGRPEEFARLVQHVVENVFINGETLRIDAGARGR
jgi:NAD(P)-dependent dehydrogenase (short-subunit alcohol dehydrogenase family)